MIIRLKYREFTIYFGEWIDYDGARIVDYVTKIDGEFVSDPSEKEIKRLIDCWWEDEKPSFHSCMVSSREY
jgi:hypothetical protein